jgi:hypothetical protein
MSGLPYTRAESARIGRDGPGDRDRSRALALLRRLRDSEAALDRMPQPPALADLDRVLAGMLQARFPVRNGPWPLASARRLPGRPAARHGFAVMSRSASATLGTAGP